MKHYRTTKGRFMKKADYDFYAKGLVMGTLFGIFLSLVCMADQVSYAKAETTPLQAIDTIAPIGLAHQIDTLSQKYNVDRNLAEAIIFCESSFKENAIHHNHNGSVDVSYWQINLDTWASTLHTNNLDPYSLEAGFWILSNYGTAPWFSSKLCWSRHTSSES